MRSAGVEKRQVGDTLGELGQRANIVVLQQLAGALSTATEAGTPPSEVLATRAEMVMSELHNTMRMNAAERTERMSVPAAMLTVFFMLYVGIPAFVGLLTGTSPIQ